MSDRIAVMHGGTDCAACSTAPRRRSRPSSPWRSASPADALMRRLGTPGSLGRPGAIVALGAVLAVVAPGFFARDNLRDLFLANVPVLIIALGMTLVILTGHIDISVGSLFAICARGLRRARQGRRADAAACCSASCALGAAARRRQRRARRLRAHPVDRRHAGDDDRAARGTALGDRGRVDSGSAGRLPVARARAQAVVSAGSSSASWSSLQVGVRLGPAPPAGRPGRLRDRSSAEAARLAGIRVERGDDWRCSPSPARSTGLAALLNSVRFNQIPEQHRARPRAEGHRRGRRRRHRDHRRPRHRCAARCSASSCSAPSGRR